MLRSLRIGMVLVALALSGAAQAQNVSEQLENGLYTEQTVGDLDAAVQIYNKVLANPQAKPEQKAQAQFRLGMCYLKKRQEDNARQAFGAVVEKYADQKELVAQAKSRLGNLITANPAALMPPEVMAYAEVGSPGAQVEKIVAMLKGTPLANPLEAMSKGRQPATGPAAIRPGAGKTPGDIIAALLNPSMLEEFKKVRGLAVGMTGLPKPGGSVPVIAVLYPGQSDALKGLVTAGLLVAGQPGEPFEEMQMLTIEGAAFAAYDDAVVIVTTSLDQLKWSIRQYKGLSKDPSLATANKSFAELTSPETRRKDALTVWAAPGAVFKAALNQMRTPNGRLPGEVQIASVLFDIESLEGAVLRLVVDERNPYLELAAVYKDGHRAVGYDLIRTPALTAEGFEAVPLDAVGLIAVALGDAQQAKAQAATQAAKRLIGLDVGRELFANIEQISIFAMPVDGQITVGGPLVSPCIGLALTSRDPKRTQELLDEILSLPGAMAGAGQRAAATAPAPKPGEYALPMLGGARIYMGQAGRSTVLASDPAVLNAALSAVKAGKDDLAKSQLRAELARMPAGTCKLAVVNAGAAVEAFSSYGRLRLPAQAQTRPSYQSQLAMYAKAAESLSRTNLMLNTVEGPNRVTARLGVLNLPPLADLFSLVLMPQGDPRSSRTVMSPAGSRPASGPVAK